ncbi:hypothetical protein FRC17_010899 [Serendipita sp. 399]|nr:hypothetical protein FRC17_010899 [Serendipita sp. 399]
MANNERADDTSPTTLSRRLRPSLLKRDYAIRSHYGTSEQANDDPSGGFVRNRINYSPPVACVDPKMTILPSSHPMQCSTSSFDPIPLPSFEGASTESPAELDTGSEPPRLEPERRYLFLEDEPLVSSPEPEPADEQEYDPSARSSSDRAPDIPKEANHFFDQYTSDDALVDPPSTAPRKRKRYHPYQKFDKLAHLYSLPQPVLWSQVDQGVPAEIAAVVDSHSGGLMNAELSSSSDEDIHMCNSKDDDDWEVVERPLIIKLKGRYWKAPSPSDASAGVIDKLDLAVSETNEALPPTERGINPGNALGLFLDDAESESFARPRVIRSSGSVKPSPLPTMPRRAGAAGGSSSRRIMIRKARLPSMKSLIRLPRPQKQVDPLPPVSSFEDSVQMETSSASSAATSPPANLEID